jgi:gamma-butyrobetaine dioxygenase
MSELAPTLDGARLGARGVAFDWSDGLTAEFPTAWILDNADPAGAGIGGHRLRTLRDLDAARPIKKVKIEGDAVDFTLPGQTLRCAISRLRAFAEPRQSRAGAADTILWRHGDEIAGGAPVPCAEYLQDDRALEQALRDVRCFGLTQLTGAGAMSGTVEKVVRRFGFIRETNYGRLFEVRVLTRPDHLAYTSQALEPHTDNPYRDPAPTLQLLHCLRNASESGVTYFVDGFALAEDMRRDHPEDFTRLARHAAPFAYTAASGDHFTARTPIIRLDADGAISGVRFNHRALGAVDFGPAETALWYEAYLRFARAADAPERRLSLKMEPGDMVIFDNERLLHGRTEITGPADRLLEGCYAERDGLLATLARLAGSSRVTAG